MTVKVDPQLPKRFAERPDATEYDKELFKRLHQVLSDVAKDVNRKIGSVHEDIAYWMLTDAGDNVTVSGGGGGGSFTMPSMSVTASEDVAAGDLINIYNSSGSVRARKAKASAAGYEAFGWTDAAVSSGDTVTVNFLGKNSHSSGLTGGAVFLSETAGLATSTCPSGSGKVAQQVGVAESSSTFAFEWQPAVLQAASHSVAVAGVLTSVVFTSSQTWTVPAGVSAAWLDMYAGGGGGGGGTGSGGGGGGGSGEYCQSFLIPVPGSTLVITIGAAGAASSSGGAGNDGGNTTVNDGTTTWAVLAGKGGNAGAAGAGGSGGGLRGGSAGVAGTAETPFFFGGSGGGTGGSTHGSGGGSGGRLTGGAGGVGSNGGGGGGATPLATGGDGGANGLSNGSNAPTANSGAGGGGGGGGTGNTTGGAGAAGKVVVYYIA